VLDADAGRHGLDLRIGAASPVPRLALAISLGDPVTLLQSPISATLLVVASIALVAPFVLKALGRFEANAD
jgi:TctA family transporter